MQSRRGALTQLAELDGEHLAIPPRLLGQAIIRQDVGALVGVRQMADPQHRHAGEANLDGGGDAAVAAMI
jgi:hypothetical protein